MRVEEQELGGQPVEFAVGLCPARQLCAEKSSVVLVVHADGGRRWGFIFILFSLGQFPCA